MHFITLTEPFLHLGSIQTEIFCFIEKQSMSHVMASWYYLATLQPQSLQTEADPYIWL